jgi:hypothetical protein
MSIISSVVPLLLTYLRQLCLSAESANIVALRSGVNLKSTSSCK